MVEIHDGSLQTIAEYYQNVIQNFNLSRSLSLDPELLGPFLDELPNVLHVLDDLTSLSQCGRSAKIQVQRDMTKQSHRYSLGMILSIQQHTQVCDEFNRWHKTKIEFQVVVGGFFIFFLYTWPLWLPVTFLVQSFEAAHVCVSVNFAPVLSPHDNVTDNPSN